MESISNEHHAVPDDRYLADRWLRHADSMWFAEEENARRLEQRVRMLVTLGTGVITIGFVGGTTAIFGPASEKLETAIEVSGEPGLFAGLALIAVLLLILAIIYSLYGILRATAMSPWDEEAEKRLYSSFFSEELLEEDVLPEEALNSNSTASWNFVIGALDLSAITRALGEDDWALFSLRYEAALRLLVRNARKKAELREAVALIHAGGSTIAVAVACWALPLALMLILR